MTTPHDTQISDMTFTRGRMREDRYLVDPDGTVRKLDPVAEHYTVCHDLTEAAQERIRQMAGCERRPERGPE
jgi:hypothetical protein